MDSKYLKFILLVILVILKIARRVLASRAVREPEKRRAGPGPQEPRDLAARRARRPRALTGPEVRDLAGFDRRIEPELGECRADLQRERRQVVPKMVRAGPCVPVGIQR